MKHKTVSHWLKGIILGSGVCLTILYALVVPAAGQMVAEAENGVFDFCYWPWLSFLWTTAIPCGIALVLAWKIAGNIGNDKSFSLFNAALLRGIAALAAGDAGFFFLGNLVLLFLNMNHPGIALFSLMVVFAGIAISVTMAALSQLVKKAAELQDQSDWTI